MENKNKKKVIIIHCWEGYPEYCWYPWVKKQLEEKGFEVIVPEMPNTQKPKLSEWLAKLKELVDIPNEDVFLVGHSLGNITIFRFLESLKDKQKIGGAVLVAGFTDDLGFEEISNFFQEPIDFQKIKERAEKFITINSDNDPHVSLKYADILKDKLGAESIVLHNMGHFSGAIENEKSCTELKEVVDSVLKIAQK